MADVSRYSVEELKQYLLKEGICIDTASEFERNQVSGAAFVRLTENDIKELAPIIGVRTQIRELLSRSKECKDHPAASQNPTPSSQKETQNKTNDLYAPSVTFNSTKSRPSLSAAAAAAGRLSAWHESFIIPERESFSGSVQRAIDTGIVSSKARQEIIHNLRTHILQHTRYPTSEEYTAVCRQLVTKYAKLRDVIGSNGFGSWKQSLRNSFKNFRRDHPAEGASIHKRPLMSNVGEEPPSKRLNTEEEEADESDEDEYHKTVADLSIEWKKGTNRRSQALIRDLLQKTARSRRKWITQERPLVFEVVTKFPCFKTSRMLRFELWQALMEQYHLKSNGQSGH